MERQFNRHVENTLIESLKASKLWNEKLKKDCENGEVFLALRNDVSGNNDRISFYHGGGNLFNFDGKDFRTHIKYAAVIDSKADAKTYVSQEELFNCKLNPDFSSSYDRIKENCSHYSGDEAEGVSKLCKKSSYLKEEYIVVLDIEIGLWNEEKKDRIDILLYNTESQKLRFVEAKHFSNKDLWATGEPKVIKQLKGYEKVIADRASEIIKEYGRFIDGINQIFGKKLPEPQEIDPKVSLLIFGFDDAQKKGKRFTELIWDKQEYQQIPIYPKGGTDGLNAKDLWKEAK